ncbi:MBL fold metallo-hydrolase [Chitinimonas arctica]|uniref:Ribonuclease Z n=1 Tax=Chitinimonas arctica TaxID=2594795 RepID=A0A516SIG2_9NEIS|nr:ribonuclease Z [Chitinimonas arctica]QDQ27940.1 MBL fold metallo-hydrolase [Chitinimonas arctica]
MDLLFLGTSSGVPTKQRNVTGLAVLEESGSAWYLVDCGEATQHQLLHTSLSVNDLVAIFITHVHGDHSYGLPGLLASAAMLGRKRPLTLVAPAALEGWIAATRAFSELYLPYELNFVAVETCAAWSGNKLQVEAVPLSHRVPSYAYVFTETNQAPSLDTDRLAALGVPAGPLWGQLRKGLDVVFGGQTLKSADFLHHPHAPRRIVVGGDNDTPSLLATACNRAQVLVHEATYTEEVGSKAGDVGHSTAAAVAAFAQSAELPNLVLTHFSARYQSDTTRSPSIGDIRAEAAAHYRGKLLLAEDFARYRLDRAGELKRVES